MVSLNPRDIKRIVFIGAECTGKSTLARAIAGRFGEPCSSEYVRQYVEQIGDRPLDATDLDPIARGQIAQEDEALARASKVVFHDTNILSSILYAEHYFDTHIEWVDDVFQKNEYNQYFFCQPDIPWEADPGQRVSDQERSILHRQFEAFLNRFELPYVTIEGSLEERIQAVLQSLESILQ